MIFYTLGPNFQKNGEGPIENFASGIWTERYTSAGDISLAVNATPEMMTRLAEGVYVVIPGSKEVMQVETQQVEAGILTVTGPSLLEFLNQRIVWFTGPGDVATGFDLVTKPAEMIRTVVAYSALNPEVGSTVGGHINIDTAHEIISNLSLDADDGSEASIEEKVIAASAGPAYDTIKGLADTYSVGISLYLDSTDLDGDYSLKFKAYRGQDHTSTQDVNPLVRFSPVLGSLTNVKELHSIAGYKNVCYAYASGHAIEVTRRHGGEGDPIPVDFKRRMMLIEVTLPEGMTDPVVISAYLLQQAEDALANNNFTRLVDGEVTPQSEFQFGVDYFLGDIVELEGTNGQLQKARITEYIRAQDGTGERSYPTVSVIIDLEEGG